MKSEKQKMLSGELYNPFGTELTEDRAVAKELLYDYNNLRPSQEKEKSEILHKLFGNVNTNEVVIIEPPFNCDYGYNIHLNGLFYANVGCVILDCARVTIGDHVLFGPNVSIYTVGHPLDVKTRNSYEEFAYPVTIGDNVWVGGNTTILPGVTIGNNAVIGAGSVVTKDVPPNTLAVGNPCKVIKENINS